MPKRKYSDEIIMEVDRLLKEGKTNREIANLLNIPMSAVDNIKYGNTGNYLTCRLKDKATKKDKDLILKIHKMLKEGIKGQDIAKSEDVSGDFVSKVNQGKYGSKYTKRIFQKSKPVSFEGILKPYLYSKRFMARLLRKINKEPHPKGCHLYTGILNSNGYGKIRKEGGIGTFLNVSISLVHRIVYELYKGKILEGMCVCHTCNNPSCVNSDHLEIGTHNENMKYMVKSNRQAKGEKHGRAKLTYKQIPEIIKLLNTKAYTYTHIAELELYNVTPATIWKIDKGYNWSHKSGRPKRKYKRKKKKKYPH